MAKGHGGRREGAGRPRGSSDHRSQPFGTLRASLARKYAEEALNTLVTIMKDKRAPTTTRLDAAVEILDRGHGRPTPSKEPVEEQAPPSASPESPEEIVAELKRRGLFPVLELMRHDLRRDIIAAGKRIRNAREAANGNTKRRPASSAKSRASSKSKSGRRENPREG